MITKFNLYREKYNDNNLNELIVKYFNENSDAIIEIIDSYEKISDVENIFEKISFLIESSGDVEKKNGYYYIDMKDKNKPTFFFNIKKEKFEIKTLSKLNEALQQISYSDLDKKNKWVEKISKYLDNHYDSEYYHTNNYWFVDKNHYIYLNDILGYIELKNHVKNHISYLDKKILKTNWYENNDDFFRKIDRIISANKFNI